MGHRLKIIDTHLVVRLLDSRSSASWDFMVDYPRLVVGHPFIYFDYRQAIFVTAFALSDTSFTESATH